MPRRKFTEPEPTEEAVNAEEGLQADQEGEVTPPVLFKVGSVYEADGGYYLVTKEEPEGVQCTFATDPDAFTSRRWHVLEDSAVFKPYTAIKSWVLHSDMKWNWPI